MNKFIKALFVIICAFLLGACYREYTPVNSKTCDLDLQIFVRQGPSVNRILSGQVEFGSNSWTSFKGDFVEENGLSHPSSFSFDGQSVHFILDIEQGRIYGTGIMENDLVTCSGTGGGTLSGPVLGDLGDWRGEWIATAIPTPSAQPAIDRPRSLSPVVFCIYLPGIVVGLLVAVYLFRLLAPSKSLTFSTGTRSPRTSALRRMSQATTSWSGPDGNPLSEYLATYTAEDKFFDLSFPVEKSSRYLGECGITVARVLDAKSSQATALEIWLFDTQGVQTISKILASYYCFHQASLRSELEQMGEVLLIRAGDMITLETKEIKVEAKVLQVEYKSGSPDSESVFEKVAIQIRVWAITG